MSRRTAMNGCSLLIAFAVALICPGSSLFGWNGLLDLQINPIASSETPGLIGSNAMSYPAGSISGIVRSGVDSSLISNADLVLTSTGKGTQYWVNTQQDGTFSFNELKPGPYLLTVFQRGFEVLEMELTLDSTSILLDLFLLPLERRLNDVVIQADPNNFGVRRLNSIEGTAIYAAKKSEVIDLASVVGNKSGNAPRQVYAKVSGLNVWESDGTGLQLGIGGRGLSPNRTENFNTRQDGYDISADALGYPESYYTPPAEALDRIEVVRGAASLQYGTQFGGLLNFVLKTPPLHPGYTVETRQTAGTYGYLGSYTSWGWNRGKWSGVSFYQFRRSEGWRENSALQQHTGYINLNWSPTADHRINLAYTHMQYLAKQPGGLTDADFEANPRISTRDRNWFSVHWNVLNLGYRWIISPKARLEVRNFGLYATKDALGELGPINRADPLGPRDLLSDVFRNAGNEVRFLQRYRMGKNGSAFAAGTRVYSGHTIRQQGLANDAFGPDFSYTNPDNLENSDFLFPSFNFAAFAENIFQITEKFSITPGTRFEHIRTSSEGYYRVQTRDLAGNILLDTTYEEALESSRNLLLAGLGAAYRLASGMEGYANISQNYRAITFNDLRVANPNFQVDPNLKDERGFSADLGFRGDHQDWLHVDASLFLLFYRDRIGQLLATDPLTLRAYRLRTNIADSRAIGLEAFIEVDWLAALAKRETASRLRSFVNLGMTDARYVRSDEAAIDGNQVEQVPPITLRSGVTWGLKGFECQLQLNYVHGHYTDATNAEFIPTATVGRIPGYGLLDFSSQYAWSIYRLEAGVTNLTNARYFTRRAVGYPGPGIIPGDGIGAYLTFGVSL